MDIKKVNKMAFIGSNSSVQPGITIGDSSTIGANSFGIDQLNQGILSLVFLLE